MAMIRYDQWSGRLLADFIWELELYPSGQLESCDSIVYAKLAAQDPSKREPVRNCSIDHRHWRDRFMRLSLDLFGGDTLGDFVPLYEEYVFVVSQLFRNKLQNSTLTGYATRSAVALGSNQSGVQNPDLFILDFVADVRSGNRLRITEGENTCPHCKQVPMICPHCHFTNWPACINCSRWTLNLPNLPENSDRNGFTVEAYPPEEWIVEGQEWDGSDFFNMQGLAFVSNRAKQWLESIHAFPIEFRPALLNIEGCEDRFGPK